MSAINDKNSIGAPKKHEKLFCYQIFHLSNILIAILDFSLLLLVKLSIIIFFALHLCISSLSLFFLLETIAIKLSFTFTYICTFKARKSDIYCFCNIWKSDTYMGSNKEKKSLQKISIEVKSNNFCYCKVGRVITSWGAMVKTKILSVWIKITIWMHWNYFVFGCTNNIFNSCIAEGSH